MSPGGRAEGMARLRRAVAQIEAGAGQGAGARAPRRIGLARALDSALGGGLADDALHEIAPAEPADGAAAMGFALALAARFLSRRPSAGLVIGEGFAAHETGALYGPGLVAHGLPLSRLVFVHAPDASAAFWAMEEALKSGGPAAVVGEIWSLRGYSLAASRRLLLAARKGRTPALLVLASAYGQAERLSSAAETRFEIGQPSAGRAAAAATCPASAAARQSASGASETRSIARRERRLRHLCCARPRAQSGGGDSTRAASCVSNGEARSCLFTKTWLSTRIWLLTTRRFLSLAAASGDRPRPASQSR